MKSQRGISQQKCNSRSFSQLKESPQRQGTQYRFTHDKIITQIEGQVIDNCLKVRTSYLPNEILWGYRFEHSCVAYDQKAAKYVVSVNNLNKVNTLA